MSCVTVQPSTESRSAAREPFFSTAGSRSKIRFYVWYVDFHPHPLKSCWLLSNISAICNFWPQFKILGRQGSPDPLTRPSWAPDLDFQSIHGVTVTPFCLQWSPWEKVAILEVYHVAAVNVVNLGLRALAICCVWNYTRRPKGTVGEWPQH